MRVVFDTNTVISALLFRGVAGWLVAHWRQGNVTPLVSRETAAEFLRVLAYPKFGLSDKQIDAFAARYLPFAERIEQVGVVPGIPLCRDIHDQKFLDLAAVGRADVLVTGDQDLLLLRASTSFSIETLAEYRMRFEKTGGEEG